jgi:glycine hydroxymethyltransferase
VRALAREHRPRLVLCGHSSYPREIDYAAFKRVAEEVGALAMADVSHIGGLIAGRALRNPLDDGFDIVTTTTHKTLRGPRGGLILCRASLAKTLDQSVFPGLQGGPHMHTVAGIAVALKKADTDEFRVYCRHVIANAAALARELTALGAVLITGGTENHLMVLDGTKTYGINGADAQTQLEAAGIVCNKQLIPDDPAPPVRPSGIRLGTPAATTRGMREPEMKLIAAWMDRVLRNGHSAEALAGIADEVKTFCRGFPIPTLN